MQHFEFKSISVEARELSNTLVEQLRKFGAEIEPIEQNVGACEYQLKFHPEEGVAVLLMLSLKDWAQSNNLTEIRATQVSNSRSQNFWRKNGFTDIGGQTCDFLWKATE